MHFILRVFLFMFAVLLVDSTRTAEAQIYPDCSNNPPAIDEYYCDCEASSIFTGSEHIERTYNSFGGLVQGWYGFSPHGFTSPRSDRWGRPQDVHDTLEEVMAQYNGEFIFEYGDFSCEWKPINGGGGGGGGGGGDDDDDTEW